MPEFPGIEKAESTADWDTAFPLTYRIRDQDDKYWHEHRGTPKAFITLTAGKEMWANRFGELTAIRFPVPTNEGVGTRYTASHTNHNGNAMERVPAVDDYRAALEQKILSNLDPAELGLRFEPVREQALKAAAESQDFGGLFIGFSFFLIAAALILMAMLFQFGLEQRSAEVGTLLALGFTHKQVRRLLLGEGSALAFIGGVIGVVGGVVYAQAMLLGLATVWKDAVGATTLKFFVTPASLLIGLVASALVAVITIWLALRKQARRPVKELLAGALECGDLSPLSLAGDLPPAAMGQVPPQKSCDKSRHSKVGWLAVAAATGLVGWALVTGETSNAGVFFGAGALVLIGGLAFTSARLKRSAGVPPAHRSNPDKEGSRAGCAAFSTSHLSLRGLARRRSRSVATAALLACGSFLILSIGVFRLDANRDAAEHSSGTGGFALIGESTIPVVADLNTTPGRESFALNEADLADVNVVQFRVRAGDDASCLNLNRARQPRLLGVDPEEMAGRFTFAKVASGLDAADGWQLLQSAIRNPQSAMEAVPAIGDLNSILWAMGKKVGDTIDYVDDRGRPFKVRIVGAVANSILQGNLIIDEAEFLKRFPGETGYQYFVMDAPTNRIEAVSVALSRAMQDYGLEVTPAVRRLNQFNAVQNTYLGTFQILGGLGLLLGSAGLGIVVLRNVLERRGELAVLMAVGFRKRMIERLVLMEHAGLLGLGLAIGLAAATVAVLPTLLSPGSHLPYATIMPTLLVVVLNGFIWAWAATRVAIRGNLLEALRNE
jgi:ABC-type antimicrobial peptide transport system permease subunit